MFMHKSWELVHDSGNKVSIIGEANMDVIARNDLASVVHAHVESSINTVDSNSPDSVYNISSVRNSLSVSGMNSVGNSSKKI